MNEIQDKSLIDPLQFLQIGQDSNAGKRFPIKTSQISANIDGTRTEIVLQQYHNRLFIIVTQTGKLGTLISATCDEENTFNIQTLLGKRDDNTLNLYARQLTQVLWAGGNHRPLLLALSLKDDSPNRVYIAKVANLILKIKTW
eukprot:TRINITY_DN8398_c2_g1_i1.p1 TRINITY_DN8398_c2_g1~~TRINITY_DN8398_c2_g1_i1.p1  ORF type:complete len:143 (-),score=27.07 TRINITY_DN8398_c2_g1_i1:42-470(-)